MNHFNFKAGSLIVLVLILFNSCENKSTEKQTQTSLLTTPEKAKEKPGVFPVFSACFEAREVVEHIKLKLEKNYTSKWTDVEDKIIQESGFIGNKKIKTIDMLKTDEFLDSVSDFYKKVYDPDKNVFVAFKVKNLLFIAHSKYSKTLVALDCSNPEDPPYRVFQDRFAKTNWRIYRTTDDKWLFHLETMNFNKEIILAKKDPMLYSCGEQISDHQKLVLLSADESNVLFRIDVGCTRKEHSYIATLDARSGELVALEMLPRTH